MHFYYESFYSFVVYQRSFLNILILITTIMYPCQFHLLRYDLLTLTMTYSYHPQDVSRAANLLREGMVLDKVLQPHESHIPFILQFMVDYNLYGMGHIHVSKLKFRNPVPQRFSQKMTYGKGDKGEQIDETVPMVESKAAFCNSPIWQTSTIPDSWMWQVVSYPCSASDQECCLVNRQSTSELEGDAVVEEILNQQFKSYTSLSQTHSETKMVPSLVPIWEEFERSGMLGVAVPLDPGKPPPSDVLRTLCGGLEFRDLLMESSNDIECIDRSRRNASPEDYTNEPMSSSNANKLRLATHSSSPQGCSPNHYGNLFGSPKIPSDQPSQKSDVKVMTTYTAAH
ncbi:hypothetical protein Leryth_016388 [Lithospermum erythrorhizon]|nr:hypothetical protein Leryth_016388 [Lithospermum erythrorhizon]